MQPVRTKYARRGIEIARDDAGVPHIRGDSWETALYGLGYMHAMDRLTQLLFSRTVAQGRSAELIANRKPLFEADCFFRQAGLYLRLEEEISLLPADVRQQLQAYCEGVNDGMQQAGRSLPMWATRYAPQPWDEAAVLLIANLLNFAGLVVNQQQQERLVVELIQAGVEEEKLRELLGPALEGADFALLRKIRIASRLSDETLELIADLPQVAGSNAWAVSPGRSASGAALLASDPHLEVNRLPAIWYEAVLQWPGNYLLGATLPGGPLCAVGRTQNLSWGVTYVKADTSDYFIEDCRLHEGRWQYRRGEQWRDFSVREETILRKGAAPHVHRVYASDVGTLETEPNALGEGLQLALSWTGGDKHTGQAISTWLRLPHVPNVDEARALVRGCPQPTLAWVLADRAGHIGWQVNGAFPARPPHHSGFYPVPAWEEANHWSGRLPVELLPGVTDPPRGFVASANESINQPGGPQFVTMPVPDYRRRRIDQRLAELPRATLQDLQALQYDVFSLQAKELLEIFLPHLPEGKLKQRLALWDCRYNPESEEATLFTRLYRSVIAEIFGQDPRQHGGIGFRRVMYLCTRAGFSMMIVTGIDRLLHRQESAWWRGRDKGELIRRAAAAISAEDVPPWSQTNAFRFVNRYFEGQFVGRALGFHTRDVPMPGCFATPFQGHLLRVATRETSFAPSYHFVTDLGRDEAYTNLPGGPSESRFSRWYLRDLARWMSGEYKRLAP